MWGPVHGGLYPVISIVLHRTLIKGIILKFKLDHSPFYAISRLIILIRIKYSPRSFRLLIRKIIYVRIVEFKFLLRCFLRIDVCCTYRLRMPNLFQPFWPVTENFFNFKEISSLGQATFYRRKKNQRGAVYDERPNAGLFYRVTVLRYKKHDSLPYKMHLVCGVSEVTSPFSLL